MKTDGCERLKIQQRDVKIFSFYRTDTLFVAHYDITHADLNF